MKIPDKMVLANRILRLVKVNKAIGAYASLFHNGREEGWHIRTGSRAVSFAENRNSDDIVVLFGLCADFNFDNNLTDKAWDAGSSYRRYFACGEIEKAAKFISRFLFQRCD